MRAEILLHSFLKAAEGNEKLVVVSTVFDDARHSQILVIACSSESRLLHWRLEGLEILISFYRIHGVRMGS